VPARGIQHIDLAVADVERSLAFYYDVLGPLGLKERFRLPTYRGTEEVVYLEYGVQGFGLRPADGGAHRYHEVGIEHLAFEVDEHAEVDDAYGRCVSSGGTIQSPPEQHYVDDDEDYYGFFAFDPDGIRVEVFCWLSSPYRGTPRAMFDVAAEAYDSFMGRYSRPLAARFCDFAGIRAEQRALDVGCGPGALIAELARRLGPAAISAIDPSQPFVEAARERHPDVDVRRGSAELLPFADDAFDASLAQLVVHFMDDPVAGLREMSRVTRPAGVVAACVWDHAGGEGPLSRFWDAARELDPEVSDESQLAGARKGHLTGLLEQVGLRDVRETLLSVSVEHASFEEWWQPFTLGVGPAGAYLATLDEVQRLHLRELCQRSFPSGRMTVTAGAWAACGIV
jgi:SAM-dependent methyltransferase/catechol 2,3-dioxygenase-like lactoylglutathione lyase family enzyme